MVAFPHCKINLGLHIVSRRSDGYHDISTSFYPLPWTDILEILPSDHSNFTQTGINIPGRKEDNLCWKAYELLRNEFQIGPINIHLHKVIPTGAGLGGGSSDAAFTLRLLNSIFKLNLSQEKMMLLASRLGSDCSFFIQDKAMHGSGRGEVLAQASVDLKGYYIVVLTPPLHVSTSEAYNGAIPKIPTVALSESLKLPVVEWRNIVVNDFESSVFKKYPVLGELKERLYAEGAVYASMSGSGSSVFGLFYHEIDSARFDVLNWSGRL